MDDDSMTFVEKNPDIKHGQVDIIYSKN